MVLARWTMRSFESGVSKFLCSRRVIDWIVSTDTSILDAGSGNSIIVEDRELPHGGAPM